MAGPGWVEQALAAVMLATAGYCAARLVAPRWRIAGHRDVDATHVAMALAMAGMLLGVARPLWAGPLALAFALPAVWFAVRAVRPVLLDRSQVRVACASSTLGHVQLSIACVAMVFMSGALPGFGTATATGGSRILSLPEGHVHLGSTAAVPSMTTASTGLEFGLVGAACFGLLAAFAVIDLGLLTASADRVRSAAQRVTWTGRLALCCQLAMGVTMAHMLAAMI